MRKLNFILEATALVVTSKASGQEKHFYTAPVFSMKTNTLYWLTTTPNLGLEQALSRRITLDMSVRTTPGTLMKNEEVKEIFLNATRYNKRRSPHTPLTGGILQNIKGLSSNAPRL